MNKYRITNPNNKEVRDCKSRTTNNIDTLVKIVDKNKGYTIIPKLHIDLLTEEQKKNIRPLVSPKIVREISIVIRKDYVRETLLNHIAEMLKSIIPEQMIDERLKKFAIRL